MEDRKFGTMMWGDEIESAITQIMRVAADHRLLEPQEEIALIGQLDIAWPGRLESDGETEPPAATPIINKISLYNIRLVISVVKKFQGQGVPFEDLINNGWIGLRRGICRFDPERGVRLSTYITNWIWQITSRIIADQKQTIRVPVHFQDKVRRVEKAVKELSGNEEEITAEGILEILEDWTEADLKEYQRLKIQSTSESMDKTIRGGDENWTYQDILPDSGPTPDEVAAASALKLELSRQIDTLTVRESKILRLRYGLEDGKSYTLQDVGERFGITRERVRQLEAQAMRKLRHPRRARHLREFL